MNSDGASSDIPLHVAAANGHPEIIRLLLQAGADVNKQVSNFVLCFLPQPMRVIQGVIKLPVATFVHTLFSKASLPNLSKWKMKIESTVTAPTTPLPLTQARWPRVNYVKVHVRSC